MGMRKSTMWFALEIQGKLAVWNTYSYRAVYASQIQKRVSLETKCKARTAFLSLCLSTLEFLRQAGGRGRGLQKHEEALREVFALFTYFLF